MEAVFATVRPAYAEGTSTVTCHATESPGASAVEVVHESALPAREQSGSVEPIVVPAGAVSPTATPAGTVEAPWFLSVRVYVAARPGVTVPDPSSFVSDRSADGTVESVSLAESFALLVSVTGVDWIEAMSTSVAGE